MKRDSLEQKYGSVILVFFLSSEQQGFCRLLTFLGSCQLGCNPKETVVLFKSQSFVACLLVMMMTVFRFVVVPHREGRYFVGASSRILVVVACRTPLVCRLVLVIATTTAASTMFRRPLGTSFSTLMMPCRMVVGLRQLGGASHTYFATWHRCAVLVAIHTSLAEFCDVDHRARAL